jgi:hypothetical protein
VVLKHPALAGHTALLVSVSRSVLWQVASPKPLGNFCSRINLSLSLVLVVLEIELRVLLLLDRQSMVCAIPPALFVLVIFERGSCFSLGLA